MSETKMTEQQRDEKFITDLSNACKTHHDWLVLMRYCLKTLLDNQRLLIRLITTEAEHYARTEGTEQYAMVARILEELDLHLEIA